ncbi:MAG: hypothetical protein Q9163_003931 [Psora crenata]
MGGSNREGQRYLMVRENSTDETDIGGKAKPLKAAKKEKKELDDDEVAFRDKQKADAKAQKEMAEKAKGKGPLNAGQQGIKKSGKK